MAKKGVTAIIATVLLLMMTVAAAGVSYTWMMGMQKGIQSSTQDKYNADLAKVNGKLSIDSMWKDAGNIQFTLKNTGTFTFKDTSKFNIYFDGLPVPDAGVTYDPAAGLIPGMVTTVSLNKPFPIAANTPNTIKVVADGGVSVVYQCEIKNPAQTYC